MPGATGAAARQETIGVAYRGGRKVRREEGGGAKKKKLARVFPPAASLGGERQELVGAPGSPEAPCKTRSRVSARNQARRRETRLVWAPGFPRTPEKPGRVFPPA